MRRTILIAAFLSAGLVLLWAQQRPQTPAHPAFEVTSVFPREIAPGQFRQVELHELQLLADQGWELVSVTPYVYRNEERENGDMRGPKPVVTQTYPAYFFKRTRLSR
jgi:hypothetical protein